MKEINIDVKEYDGSSTPQGPVRSVLDRSRPVPSGPQSQL
jgi:hypothetical protein